MMAAESQRDDDRRNDGGRGGNKRRRTIGKYFTGAIVRLAIENFMTYDNVEFKPQPHLNMVIGPNGTGKSTIVCAMCLALGGKTEVLGRAKKEIEFIKHGSDFALLEIELQGPPNESNTTIRRCITPGGSKWWINGVVSYLKDVLMIVQGLNVQIDNLCQFLPQDKVAEFSKMTPVQLLVATQDAIASSEVVEYHKSLITMRAEEKEIEQQLKADEIYLTNLRNQNISLEQEVQRFKERETHLQRVALLEKKKAWMEYERKRNSYFHIKKEKSALLDRIKELEKQNEPLLLKLTGLQKDGKNMNESVKTEESELKNFKSELSKLYPSVLKMSQDVSERREEINSLKSERVVKERELAFLKKAISSNQEKVNALPDPASYENDLIELKKSLRNIGHELSGIKAILRQKHTEGKTYVYAVQKASDDLKKLSNVKTQKLNALRDCGGREAYNGALWVANNQNIFEAEVYEPIAVTLNVDAQMAKYVETAIPNAELKAFVCQNSRDQELLTAELKDSQKLRVNIVTPPEAPLSYYTHPYPMETLRKYGFTHYLLDLVADAPDPVKRHLCAICGFHRIPVGGPKVLTNAALIERDLPELHNYYTPDSTVNHRKSRYTGNVATSFSSVRDAKLLLFSVDVSRKEYLEACLRDAQTAVQQLRDDMESHKREEENLVAQQFSLINEQNKFEQIKNEHKKLAHGLKQSHKKLNSAIEWLEDFNTEEEKQIQMLHSSLAESVKHTASLAIKVKRCPSLIMNISLSTLKKAKIDDLIRETETLSRTSSVELTQIKQDVAVINSKVSIAKDDARKALTEARKMTGGGTASDADCAIPPELKEAFATLPEDYDELVSMLIMEQTQVRLNENSDGHCVQVYEKRAAEISKRAYKLAEAQTRQSELAVGIDDLSSKWLTPLRKIVSKINDSLSKAFTRLKYAGEAQLTHPGGSARDFNKYAIELKVQFRASTRLQLLDQHTQSGGERAVSTILFMMALQQLTRCPFRVVDEINQGMDPNNERRVFKEIVAAASQDNTPQYFLITPKLLPDLDYNSKTNVLCVYNGTTMCEWDRWDLSSFLQKKN